MLGRTLARSSPTVTAVEPPSAATTRLGSRVSAATLGSCF